MAAPYAGLIPDSAPKVFARSCLRKEPTVLNSTSIYVESISECGLGDVCAIPGNSEKTFYNVTGDAGYASSVGKTLVRVPGSLLRGFPQGLRPDG